MKENYRTMPLITAYQVTYGSESDQFTTIQLSRPPDRRFYRVQDSTSVVLQAVHPNLIDTSNVREPVVRTPRAGGPCPCPKRSIRGLVKVDRVQGDERCRAQGRRELHQPP